MNKYHLDTNSTADRKIADLTKLGIRNALIIGKYQYNSARQKLNAHLHKGMMEICYCHKGEQVYEVANRSYRIKGGDVFVTFPDEMHSTGDHPEEKGVLYWLVIKIPFSKDMFFHYGKKESVAFIDALINLPVRHFKGNAEMKKTLETILAIADNSKNKMQRIILENLLISFLIQVIETAANTALLSKPLSDNAAKIHLFIMHNFKEEISIEAMAKMLHLSVSRFKSWFKEEFGIPPLDFILRKRVEEAKMIMQKQPALSMSDIAYTLGFSSPQYFATVFKRYTFLSPMQYKAST
jgi:AraC-like DNA-binding protein